MKVAVATTNELDSVDALIADCRQVLETQGILQWDSQYPNRTFFEESIASRSLFVLSDEEQIFGVVVLNEWQLPEWSTVTWHRRSGPVLVIHAFAISPNVQGRGHGRMLLNFCEDFARKQNYTSIRLDAFSENSTALRFYERHGYVLRGQVQYAFKPIGHQRYRYCCYEKSLT